MNQWRAVLCCAELRYAVLWLLCFAVAAVAADQGYYYFTLWPVLCAVSDVTAVPCRAVLFGALPCFVLYLLTTCLAWLCCVLACERGAVGAVSGAL